MTRRLLALWMLFALAVPGFARGALLCDMDQQVHAVCCCGDDADEVDACCEAAEDDGATVLPSEAGPDLPVLVALAEPAPPGWPPRATRPADPARYVRGPPPTGPPLFLKLRSLLR